MSPDWQKLECASGKVATPGCRRGHDWNNYVGDYAKLACFL